MFDPSASSPPDLPPPPPVDRGAANPRYVYLLTRLRGRQITMEEAIELFALQQALLRAASSASRVPAPAGAAAPTPALSGLPMRVDDDGLAYGLLLLGAGAGVLAAVLKRSREGPAAPKPTSPR